MTPTKNVDLAARLGEFERGELDREEVIELFQALVDSGVVFCLQGNYQRLAQRLVNEGEIAWH
jgi:hypothetical protein